MKEVGFIVCALLIAFGAPILMEEAQNSCHALERKLAAVIPDTPEMMFLGGLLSQVSNGEVMRTAMKSENPNVPAPVSCKFAYWRVTFDPGVIDEMRSALKQ